MSNQATLEKFPIESKWIPVWKNYPPMDKPIMLGYIVDGIIVCEEYIDTYNPDGGLYLSLGFPFRTTATHWKPLPLHHNN